MTLSWPPETDPALVLPLEADNIRTIVDNGWHNAFAAFTKWQDKYWLAFRQGSGHIARDGDIVVQDTADLKQWQECQRFDVWGDDRDAQLLPTKDRLWLYINSLKDGEFKIFASFTEDGKRWSAPQIVYRHGFILWKPVQFKGRFYAAAHRPGTNAHRLAHLITSTNGLEWEFISVIRQGTGESETALVFDQGGKITAFLRDQTKVGGAILEALPPYKQWHERPAGVHLSGQAVYTFKGTTYLISRVFACNPPVLASASRATLPEKLDQATMVYTYEMGHLKPYYLLGPLAGNHDSSYATALCEEDELLVVFHRSEHEFTGTFCQRDAATLLLARMPLKNTASR